MGNDIFYTLLISNFEIEFLKEEDLMNELGLGILLVHAISECRMVGEYGGFGPKKVWMKIFQCEHNCQELLLSCSIVQLGIIKSPT